MVEKTPTILEDDREISAVYWNDDDGSCQIVGHADITKIVAYGEPSQHCLVPWLAFYKGDQISSRVSAGQVEIHYKRGETI